MKNKKNGSTNARLCEKSQRRTTTMLGSMILATTLLLMNGLVVEEFHIRQLMAIHVDDATNAVLGSQRLLRYRSNNADTTTSSSADSISSSPQEAQEPGAAKIQFEVDPSVQDIYDSIDSQDNEIERCQKYGFTYTPAGNNTRRRRIFFGALVASDTKEVLQIHATETYDIYHTVALLESNTTFLGTPRELRFAVNGSDLHDFVTTSGVFGKNTNVFVDSWLEQLPNATNAMTRETLQREFLIHRWKQQGMRPDDIGIVGDIDEFFSRDFLRAAQVCNIPEFQEPIISACVQPKVLAMAISYEASPECRKVRKWYHADMILGACIDGIGDPTGRVLPVRTYGTRRGDRAEGYTHDGYLPEIVASGRYPLWTTQDFRRIGGGTQHNWAHVRNSETSEWGTAFHIHNFFQDMNVLRDKYATYGHPKSIATYFPLSKINNDLDVLVRCIHGLPNVAFPKAEPLLEKPFHKTKGPTPIFFRNEAYRQARHEHVQTIVWEDEKRFGSKY